MVVFFFLELSHRNDRETGSNRRTRGKRGKERGMKLQTRQTKQDSLDIDSVSFISLLSRLKGSAFSHMDLTLHMLNFILFQHIFPDVKNVSVLGIFRNREDTLSGPSASDMTLLIVQTTGHF